MEFGRTASPGSPSPWRAASLAGLLAALACATGCDRAAARRLNVVHYDLATEIESEDLVWIEVVPSLSGVPRETATVAARGADLEMPWVAELPQRGPHGAKIREDEGGQPSRRFFAPAGCTLALAAFDPVWGLAEREWTVPKRTSSRGSAGGQPVQVEVPLGVPPNGEPPPSATLEWTHRSGRSSGYVDRRAFELRSPRFGLLLERREVAERPGTRELVRTWELPSGDYRVLVTAPKPQGAFCGTGPPVSDRHITVETAVRLQAGERRTMTTEDRPAGPVRFEPRWVAGKAPKVVPNAKTPFSSELSFLRPAVGKPGVTAHLLRSDGDFPFEQPLSLSGFGIFRGGFFPSTPVGKAAYSRRAFPTGTYELVIRGAEIEEKRVAIDVLPKRHPVVRKTTSPPAPPIELRPPALVATGTTRLPAG